jgi:hypothetical protein
MTDTVFDIHTQLGKSLIVAVGLEDRIVAEAFPSPTLSDNLTFDDSLELVDLLDARATTRADVLFLY